MPQRTIFVIAALLAAADGAGAVVSESLLREPSIQTPLTAVFGVPSLLGASAPPQTYGLLTPAIPTLGTTGNILSNQAVLQPASAISRLRDQESRLQGAIAANDLDQAGSRLKFIFGEEDRPASMTSGPGEGKGSAGGGNGDGSPSNAAMPTQPGFVEPTMHLGAAQASAPADAQLITAMASRELSSQSIAWRYDFYSSASNEFISVSATADGQVKVGGRHSARDMIVASPIDLDKLLPLSAALDRARAMGFDVAWVAIDRHRARGRVLYRLTSPERHELQIDAETGEIVKHRAYTPTPPQYF